MTTGSPATVLIVDDEAGVRDLERHILERAGFTVVEATDGAEALKIVAGETPLALVVADVDMPNLSGDDMAREVAKTRPGLKILFVTGHVRKLFKDEPLLQEDRAFLAKPFTAASLIEAVSLLKWGTLTPNFDAPVDGLDLK
jgi:CheY-like chemotaxis protein